MTWLATKKVVASIKAENPNNTRLYKVKTQKQNKHTGETLQRTPKNQGNTATNTADHTSHPRAPYNPRTTTMVPLRELEQPLTISTPKSAGNDLQLLYIYNYLYLNNII